MGMNKVIMLGKVDSLFCVFFLEFRRDIRMGTVWVEIKKRVLVAI